MAEGHSQSLSTAEALRLEIERKTARLAVLRAKRESNTAGLTSAPSPAAPPTFSARGWQIGYEDGHRQDAAGDFMNHNPRKQNFDTIVQQHQQLQEEEEDDYYYDQHAMDYDETSTVVSDLTTPTVNYRHVPPKEEKEALSSAFFRRMPGVMEAESKKLNDETTGQAQEIQNIQENLMSMALGQRKTPRKESEKGRARSVDDLLEEIEEQEEQDMIYSCESPKRKGGRNDVNEGSKSDKVKEGGDDTRVGGKAMENTAMEDMDEKNLQQTEENAMAWAQARLKKSPLGSPTSDDGGNKANKEDANGTATSGNLDKMDNAKSSGKKAIHPSPEVRADPPTDHPSKEYVTRNNNEENTEASSKIGGSRATEDTPSKSRTVQSTHLTKTYSPAQNPQHRPERQPPPATQSESSYTPSSSPTASSHKSSTTGMRTHEDMNRLMDDERMYDRDSFGIIAPEKQKKGKKSPKVDRREVGKEKQRSRSGLFGRRSRGGGDTDSSTRQSEEKRDRKKKSRFARMFGGSHSKEKDSHQDDMDIQSRKQSLDTKGTTGSSKYGAHYAASGDTAAHSAGKENVRKENVRPAPLSNESRLGSAGSRKTDDMSRASRRSNHSGSAASSQRYYSGGAALTRGVEDENGRHDVKKANRTTTAAQRDDLSRTSSRKSNRSGSTGQREAEKSLTRRRHNVEKEDATNNEVKKASKVSTTKKENDPPAHLSNEGRVESSGSRKHHPDDASRKSNKSNLSGSAAQREAEKSSAPARHATGAAITHTVEKENKGRAKNTTSRSGSVSSSKTPDGSSSQTKDATGKKNADVFAGDPFDPFVTSPIRESKTKAFDSGRTGSVEGMGSAGGDAQRVAIDADGFLYTVKPPLSSSNDASPPLDWSNGGAANAVDAGTSRNDKAASPSPLKKQQKDEDSIPKSQLANKGSGVIGSIADGAAVTAKANEQTERPEEQKMDQVNTSSKSLDQNEPSTNNIQEDIDKMSRARLVKRRIEMLRKEVGEGAETELPTQKQKDPEPTIHNTTNPKRRKSDEGIRMTIEKLREELEEVSLSSDESKEHKQSKTAEHKSLGSMENDKGFAKRLEALEKEIEKEAKVKTGPRTAVSSGVGSRESGADKSRERNENRNEIAQAHRELQPSTNKPTKIRKDEMERKGETEAIIEEHNDPRTAVRSRGVKNRDFGWERDGEMEGTARAQQEVTSSPNRPTKSAKDAERLKKVEELRRKLQQSRDRLMASAAQFERVSDDRNMTKPRSRQMATSSSILAESRERRKKRNSITEPNSTSAPESRKQEKRSISAPPGERAAMETQRTTARESRQSSSRPRYSTSTSRSTRPTSVPPSEQLSQKSKSRLSARSRTVLAESRERLAASRARLRTLTT